jgi:hypothetical protein
MASIGSPGPISSLRELAACRDLEALHIAANHVTKLLDAANTRASKKSAESEDASWVAALARTLTQLMDHFGPQQHQETVLISSLCHESLKYQRLLGGAPLTAALPLHYAYIRKLVSLQLYNAALHHGWELYRCLQELLEGQPSQTSSPSDVAIGTILNLVVCSSEAGQCLPQQAADLNEAVSNLLRLLRYGLERGH